MQVLNQNQKLPTLSNRYAHITTNNIINAFERDGYTVRSISTKRVNNAEKDGFQGHLVRMQRADLQLKALTDVKPEIVIKNSHDGTSSLKIYLGIFRLVCSNGLIAGSTFDSISVRHVGDAINLALMGAEKIKNHLPQLDATLKTWKERQLTENQIKLLEFMSFRLIAPTNASMLRQNDDFFAVRNADASTDLWTVYNRIQERIVNGGIRYQYTTDDNKLIFNTTRCIKSIDRLVDVNRQLFDIAKAVA